MADIFCRSIDGNNANDGSTRALAKKTLEDNGMSSTGNGALTAAGAGGRVLAAHDHAQTEAATIILIGGLISTPIQLLSTDFSTNGSGVPDERSGASVKNTGAGNDIDLRGYAYVSGFTIEAIDDILVSAVSSKWVFDKNSILRLPTAGGGIVIGLGTGDNNLSLLDSNIDMSNSGSIGLFRGAVFNWVQGSFVNTPSVVLFENGIGGTAIVRDVDLSSITSALVAPDGVLGKFSVLFERCKLNASVTVISSAINSVVGTNVRLHSCDSADTTFSIHEEHFEGTIIEETTIVRTGGASDGITPLSLKMTSNANALEFVQPLVSPPLSTNKIKTLGLKTLTVEFIHDSLTNLQNDEIWMEVEDSTGATAQGRITNDKLTSILGTPADQPSSTATWDTSGLTNPNKQKLSVDITLLKIGPITVRVYLAKPSTTAYLDFKVVVS